MFKFLKSKKGFTLVELMIVVVIMAILVAVAVPIYSAVTANARKKTCIGNQREIISQINNHVMTAPEIVALADESTATIRIQTNANGDGVADGGVTGITDVFESEETFLDMFNEDNFPFCPDKNSYLDISITTGVNEGYVIVNITCKDTTHVS